MNVIVRYNKALSSVLLRVRTSVCQGLKVECCHRITYMYMLMFMCHIVCLMYADDWYLAGLQELLH